MKYTKRSLVGLFTLSIMQSGVVQASNNAPYPFGEEFVYHTCPSGFDKQGLSCTKKITKPVLVKCDSGYNLSSNKQSCTKSLSKSVTYSCPSGYRMESASCLRVVTEKDYAEPFYPGPYMPIDKSKMSKYTIGANGPSSIYWKGKKYLSDTVLVI
ncbi:exported hypothetical protein [Vibrio chagasii]|nr:exported hypothetical protein [Vibrio chagasii]CAH6906188.1 exported hypothetical protein [Vibrio chagasii]CAH6916237.1 exported hypothetical protein [Vibrio chagasii]